MVQTNDAATLVGGKTNFQVGFPPEPAAARYEEIEEINRGGCGVVIRAFDKHLQCEVALKRILPELAHDAGIKSRFFHEARVTARLAHPGIAPIHDAGDDINHGSPFYTMKWLQGQTLDEVIKAHHALPSNREKSRSLRELLVRFRHVCQTLSYAHQHGIVHRDLKPANILIGQFGETIVLDWGLAKEITCSTSTSNERACDTSSGFANNEANYAPAAIQSSAKGDDTSSSSQELTLAGAILGTASYMSPEQAAGQSHLVDRRADVFSLGVILYEILAGKSPFRCPTQQETLQRVLRSEYRSLQQVRPRVQKPLAAICERALKLEPSARYADAGELHCDIQAWLAGDCVSAYAEPWWGTIDRLASKYRTIFWSALVSLLVISVISIASTVTISGAHRNEKQARQAAESAHALMSQSLVREQDAHQEAVTQLQQARASIDGWLLGLDSVLALYPGLKPLRNQLFQQAIDYYMVLAQQAADSELMNLEVIRAKIRLADLQHLNGRTDDALAGYRHAVALLCSGSPIQADWQTIADLQHAAALLGTVEIEIENSKLDEVHAFIDISNRLCASVSESSPQFSEASELIARGLRLKSIAFRHRGELDQSEMAIKRAITLYESRILPTNTLHSTTQQRQVFLSMLDDLASTLIDARDYASANDALQRMIHFYDRLLDTDPMRPDWLEARALARTRSGWCYMQLVEPNQAVAELEASEDDLQNAWQLFKGERTYLDKLAQIHNALGHSYFVGGDLDQAQLLLTRSMGQSSHKPDPQREPDALSQWIQTRLYLATIQIRRGTPDSQLLEDVEEAIADLMPHDRWHAAAVQAHAQYHWLLGQTLTFTGEQDLAADKVEQAIAWQVRQPIPTQDASWHFWMGRLFAVQASIAPDATDSARCLLIARQHWQTAYDTGEKRWSAHAAFDLFESWAHSSELDTDHLQTALEMVHDVVRDHEMLPTAWFWLAELAHHQGDHDSASSALEKLERLRRLETLEDRLLKALIHSSPSPALLTMPCVPRSHAAWLQERLNSTH